MPEDYSHVSNATSLHMATEATGAGLLVVGSQHEALVGRALIHRGH
jgi:hypothetical protein